MPLNTAEFTIGITVSPQGREIIEKVMEAGPISRNDLTKLMGVSRSTVTKAVVNLCEQGLLVEQEYEESSGGRRPVLVDINPDFGTVIGIDMGITRLNLCVANFRGDILASKQMPITINDVSPERFLDSVNDEVVSLLHEAGATTESVRAIGFGVPAPVDEVTERVASPTKLSGWESFDIREYLRTYYPQATIRIENDVNLMALGEHKIGAGQGHDNLVVIKIGTGIGAGIICNGKIFRGSNGISGSIGHISIDRDGPICYCGNVGCLEKYAAGPAIVERAMAAINKGESDILADMLAAGDGRLTTEDIGMAASQGDPIANAIIVDSAREIGRILAVIVGFFNPSLVVLAGGVSQVGPQFVVAVHRTILEYSLPLSSQHLTVHKSEVTNQAGMAGAVLLALESVFILE
ncbi:ROK family protein [Phototrophicus methaneseepsis]|uniref:ROK family protein n=1 Tax=Phototrophicus methaneseepsis TaxID=2710758 RepID=A0A7S8EBR7_9CHLR|nr:ROK family transcriptional regulator [Phototrophicus methaneseepsis]QPC84067.1 ROK family protein [Phototrophicus methaneseepsis]